MVIAICNCRSTIMDVCRKDDTDLAASSCWRISTRLQFEPSVISQTPSSQIDPRVVYPTMNHTYVIIDFIFKILIMSIQCDFKATLPRNNIYSAASIDHYVYFVFDSSIRKYENKICCADCWPFLTRRTFLSYESIL